jgi:hypothetical protein
MKSKFFKIDKKSFIYLSIVVILSVSLYLVTGFVLEQIDIDIDSIHVSAAPFPQFYTQCFCNGEPSCNEADCVILKGKTISIDYSQDDSTYYYDYSILDITWGVYAPSGSNMGELYCLSPYCIYDFDTSYDEIVPYYAGYPYNYYSINEVIHYLLTDLGTENTVSAYTGVKVVTQDYFDYIDNGFTADFLCSLEEIGPYINCASISAEGERDIIYFKDITYYPGLSFTKKWFINDKIYDQSRSSLSGTIWNYYKGSSDSLEGIRYSHVQALFPFTKITLTVKDNVSGDVSSKIVTIPTDDPGPGGGPGGGVGSGNLMMWGEVNPGN